MRTVNKFIKFLGYLGVYSFTFLQSYILSLICSGAIMTVVCSVISAVTSLPEILMERYWLIYLVGSVPLAIIFFIIIVCDLIDLQTDYRAKRKLEALNKKRI